MYHIYHINIYIYHTHIYIYHTYTSYIAKDYVGMVATMRRELIPEEYREDPMEVAPTRRKVNHLEENVDKLAKKPAVQMSDLLLKAIQVIEELESGARSWRT